MKSAKKLNRKRLSLFFPDPLADFQFKICSKKGSKKIRFLILDIFSDTRHVFSKGQFLLPNGVSNTGQSDSLSTSGAGFITNLVLLNWIYDQDKCC